MKKISIVVPVYNVARYISKCIESILAQSYREFELILVDDGSMDNSGFICDKYAKLDNRVKVIHKQNGGVSSARNAGIRTANGEYITFCDSDDYVASDWLETMYGFVYEKNIDCVSIDYTVVNDTGLIKTIEHIPGTFVFKNNYEKMKFVTNYVFQGKTGWEVWTRLFKTSIIKDNNIYFCETCENFAEDMAFWLEYLMCTKTILSIRYCGYYYYQRENSMMHNSIDKIKLNSMNEVSKHFYAFLDKKFVDIEHRKFLSDYPLIHFFIMLNQLGKVKAEQIKDSLSEEVNRINQIKWYNKMMRKIPKYYKQLSEFYGKQLAFEYCNLCRYTVHKNYKRYCIDSGIYYKFLNRG